MPYALTHVLVRQALQLHTDDAGNDTVIVRCASSGRLRVRHAGALTLYVIAHCDGTPLDG
jgi:hypothetical protein